MFRFGASIKHFLYKLNVIEKKRWREERETEISSFTMLWIMLYLMGPVTQKCDQSLKTKCVLKYMDADKRERRGLRRKHFFTTFFILVASYMSSLLAKTEDWDHEDIWIHQKGRDKCLRSCLKLIFKHYKWTQPWLLNWRHWVG